MKDSIDFILKLVALLAIMFGFHAYLDSRYTKRETTDVRFGDRQEFYFGFINEAKADGIVTAFLHIPPNGSGMRFWVAVGPIKDLSQMPVIAQDILTANDSSTLTFPVRKGEFWQVAHDPNPSGGTTERLCFVPLEKR